MLRMLNLGFRGRIKQLAIEAIGNLKARRPLKSFRDFLFHSKTSSICLGCHTNAGVSVADSLQLATEA